MGRGRRTRRYTRRKQFRVFDGIVHIFDRSYGTRKGAERRLDELSRDWARIYKLPKLKIWETWISIGRKR